MKNLIKRNKKTQHSNFMKEQNKFSKPKYKKNGHRDLKASHSKILNVIDWQSATHIHTSAITSTDKTRINDYFYNIQ